MSIHAMTAERFGRLVGGHWTCEFKGSSQQGAARRVFRSNDDPTDLRILGLEPLGSNATPVTLSGESTIYLETWRDDPAMADLIHHLQRYSLDRILRYRPGKRMTVLARDAQGQHQVLKTNARGIGHSHDNLAALHGARDTLGFEVAKPLWIGDERTVFAQSFLAAAPLDWSVPLASKRLANALARAIDTLHQAPIVFTARSGLDEQAQRSARHVAMLLERHPSLQGDTTLLLNQLDQLASRIDRSPAHRDRVFQPIHGSLHAEQWMQDGDRLALVDVERCAMGYPEQDAAHFVGTWDYEHSTRGEPITAAFLAAMPTLAPDLFTWFRTHRHLAKAWKATRAGGPDARDKTRRNLQRAQWMLGASLRRTS